MTSGLPRVTIALQVYNGEDYLHEAIGDLLAQDFTDFELVISDNASTDTTPKIIADRAASDRRIRVVRHAQNIGATRNFETAFEYARSPYFMFAAHDDRWAPGYLGRMVAQLDTHPRAVIACSDSAVIDEYANLTGKIYPSVHTVDLDLIGRIRMLISQFAWVESYGLMRSEALRAIGGFKPFVGADVVFLMEMTILGEIATIHEPLFFYRMPSTRQTDHAYYASKAPAVPQDPQTYNALCRYMYRAVLAANVSDEILTSVRQAFVDAIGVPSSEWFAAIAAERRIDARTVSPASAQAMVAELLTP
jgi:glycosyltransferase involved in cell wall biosynthesis